MNHCVQPLTVETLGQLSFSKTVFVTELSRRLSASTAFLLQPLLSIDVKRFNSVQSKKLFSINLSLM